MTSSISFSGLATGIDTDTMIEQLVSLEAAKVTLLAEKQDNYSSQIEIIQNLNSKLQALQNVAEDLSTIDDFLSYETETSDDDYITLSASGSASPGSYSIVVDSLATAERRYSNGFSAEDEAGVAGAGTLTITIDDGDDETVDTAEIEITASDTLESIVSKINSTSVEVTAGILYDGTNYYLQLSGKITGQESAISVTEGAGLSLGLDDAEANIVQTASDAQIQMDGFTITSDSNEVTTAIQGVTLRLQDVTEVDAPITVTISPNSDAIIEKIQGFVDAYNEVMSIIHDEFSYTGEAKDAGHLTGDFTLRSIQSQLSSLTTTIFDDLPGGVKALAQIGVTTDSDGNLELDTGDLADAIADNCTGVAQLFAGTSDHSVEGLADKLDDLIDSYIDYSDGALTIKVSGLNSSIASLEDSIERQEDYLTSYEENLRAKFTAMELMVSTLQSQSNYLSSI